MGDLNSRIGVKQDYIEDSVDNIPDMDWYVADKFCTPRNTRDKETNTYGKSLLELCIENNMHVLNGRCGDDTEGQFTFINERGCSCIDYVICSSDMFNWIKDFSVDTCDTSCHFPVLCSFKLDKQSRSSTGNTEQFDTAVKYKWSPEIRNQMANTLSKNMCQDMIATTVDMCSGSANINTITAHVSRIYETATNGFKCKQRPERKNAKNKKTQPKWWDSECEQMKREKYKKLDVFRLTNDQHALEEYRNVRKRFKSVCKLKEEKLQECTRQQLLDACNKPNEFWKCIKNLNGIPKASNNISPEAWIQHCQQLYTKVPNTDELFERHVMRSLQIHDTDCEECNNNMPQSLNRPFTVEEVVKCINGLPNGKSGGLDGYTYEIIKASVASMGHCLTCMYNKILKCGVFPEEWGKGMLTMIHKKGSTEDPKNYRGISLLPVLCKVFTKLLNNRLVEYAEAENMQAEEQAAYRKGYSTVDQIYVLQSLVQKQLCKKGGRYYVIFIDFAAAFDSVPHLHLIYTLIKNGIHGGVLSVLKTMYDQLKSCVKTPKGLTQFIECTVGVRQGCVVSTFIFSMYIQELVNMMNCYDCKGVYINEHALNIMMLMYADDIAEGGLTVGKLQEMINVTEEFCDKWGMELNLSKTKIMIFKKGGVRKSIEKWFYKGQEIEVVSLYKYLGILFSCGLSWGAAVKTLSAQAKKVMYMLTKYSKACGDMPVKVSLKLFDSIVKPVALYGAEIWGTQVHKSLEDVQTTFCKRTLGLPKQATNLACVAECGRYPLFVSTYIKCIKYWLKILQLPDHRYVKACYKDQVRLDENKKVNWVTHIREMLQRYGFGEIWTAQGVANVPIFISTLRQRIQSSYYREWNNEIRNMSKMSIYNTFKTVFTAERYIHALNVMKFRRAYSRFRCSNHQLEIELGRRNNVFMEDRICKWCEVKDIIVIEDEYHFLLRCELYDELRQKYPHLCISNDNICYDNFIRIMDSQDDNIIIDTATFIYNANVLRDNALKGKLRYCMSKQ